MTHRLTQRAALVALTLSAAACAPEVVVHGLDERAANELLVVLAAAEVPAEKLPGDEHAWNVAVAPGQQARALAVLGSAGLPRRVPETPPIEGGLVPSEESEAATHARALSAALESTLLAMPGVYDARVHVVPPARADRAAPGAATSARAAVVVVHDARQAPPDEQTIRAIVQGAVAGIGPDAIAVVWSPVTLPEAPPTSIVPIGPFMVQTQSASMLKAVLAGLTGAVSALTLLVLVLASRLRRSA